MAVENSPIVTMVEWLAEDLSLPFYTNQHGMTSQ
jgi:hypothetical protein